MKKAIASVLAVTLLIAASLTVKTPARAAGVTEASQAAALKRLGLFRGVSATDFDLGRAPTRTEALVMLIRVLGEESEALKSDRPHPFTDVAPWADRYVGYAYAKGLTKGISATLFGTGDANSDMYLTFVLRALGYDDAGGDFVWDEPDALAKSAGVLPSSVDTAKFLRADVARVSWSALEAKLKDGSRSLSEKLIGAGAFKPEDYRAARQIAAGLPTAIEDIKTIKSKMSHPSDQEILIYSYDELKSAVQADSYAWLHIVSDMEITDNLVFRPNDAHYRALYMYIHAGVTVTVSAGVSASATHTDNFGSMVLNAPFTLSGDSFIYSGGSVTVKDGGEFNLKASSCETDGAFTVHAGGKVSVDGKSSFTNHPSGVAINNGSVTVAEGGVLRGTDMAGTGSGTGTPAGEGKVVVSAFAEFKAAVQDKKTAEISVHADFDVSADLAFEREDDLVIRIEKGKTLTVSKTFQPVFCSIVNDGNIVVNGTFDRGACKMANNGSVIVKKGGTASSGMADTDNTGSFTVEAGGTLLIERGTVFNNLGTLTNNGYIRVKDGGQLNDKGGSLINDGTIDLHSTFNGDIKKILGKGALNDRR